MKSGKILLTLFMVLLTGMAQAQGSMDNLMRSNGKIWVVIAVVVTIFLGIILYLVRLDRKITKLENRNS